MKTQRMEFRDVAPGQGVGATILDSKVQNTSFGKEVRAAVVGDAGVQISPFTQFKSVFQIESVFELE